MSCYVGKVNMNRNSPVYLREISTNQALRDTERWLCETKEAYRTVKPILTPRFIPSCTDDLMYGLARLQAKYGVPVQSHLSENYSEIAWIRELCPRSKHYGDAYEQFGLFGGGYPCIMAHCVHSNEDEQALMKKNGVFIAHSPESNMNLASGVAPVNKFLDDGLRVGLATDVAGGSHEYAARHDPRHSGLQAPLAAVRSGGKAAALRARVLSGHHGRRRVLRKRRQLFGRL
ncbi:MAG: amidohydrolase family protein [Acutalibacteraceae bacterium]